MSVATIESLKDRTAALKKKLAEKGAKMDAPAQRRLKKNVRRAQRRRRKMQAAVARKAGKAEKKSE